ncbi:MAG: LLM class F420-dependent oxidoreductase [Candidatus Binatia bacterium]|nr:LLM class F420-dependent oxidoreductase [Candidatus Binatia bacterium]
MKFALAFPFFTAPPLPEFTSGEAIRQIAVAAEAAGFDAVFSTEHPAPPDDWRQTGGHDALDPFVSLAFAAAATTRIRLLTNLTVVPYRNPLLLAKTVATLDRLSDGRLTLGVGTGYLEKEYEALGVEFAERNDLFDEAMEVLRLAWTGEPVTFQGSRFSAVEITCQPVPTQPLGPPFWVGGNSRLARRRAVRWGEGWMPMPNPRKLGDRRRSAHLETLDDLRGLLRYLRTEEERAGRKLPLEVLFAPLTGGVPGTRRWSPAEYGDSLLELRMVGVTWVNVAITGRSLGSLTEAIARFGEEIISAHR